jgi:uncharacterized RmlC-like cupin family protein
MRGEDAAPGPATPGMTRHELFDDGEHWAGFVRTDAGVSSGWHHHAANDTYVYVLGGSLTIDFGPGGSESVVAGGGDFIFVPSDTIHRETTSADGAAEAFVLRIGRPPQLVNVDGPDPA